MTNDTKRLVACILFGLAALGSFTTSYLHVAAYFAPVMPAAWTDGAYVAALALDMLAVACGYGLLLSDRKAPGRAWLHVGLWAPVALSVWANWRYAAQHVGADAWAFDPVVSACLPVLLVIATHGLAAVLRAVPADAPEAETPDTAALIAAMNAPISAWENVPLPPAVAPPKPAPKARKAAPKDWHPRASALLSEGYKGADVARMIGVHPSQVSRFASANGIGANGTGQGAS